MTDLDKLTLRIKELTGWRFVDRPRILTDTSNWMAIKRGDILRLRDKDYVIKGNKHETRFGIGEQPKYWVFSALDMETGAQKIIKTEFFEDFNAHIGIFKIHCYRSPEKEGLVLSLTGGDQRYMQGFTIEDDKGNKIRVIDFIKGDTFFNYIHGIAGDHENYFHTHLPRILHNLVDSIEAIQFLHDNNTCHGDIRNDHIIIDAETGLYRWIDFDLNQNVSDFDMWSIGNVINYAVGKGINSFQQVMRNENISDKIKSTLKAEDASAFYEYRIMNLKKLYPYIPDKLNEILLHFTARPRDYYMNIKQLLDDYREMLEKEFPL